MGKSNTNCCVPGCTSVKRTNGDLSFHTFPIDKIRKKQWLHVLRIGKKISNSARVCSNHFSSLDYFKTVSNKVPKRKVLKKTAIPNAFLPTSSTDKQLTPKQLQGIKEREQRCHNKGKRLNMKENYIHGNLDGESEIEDAAKALVFFKENMNMDEKEEDAFCRKVGHRERTDLEAAELLLALQENMNMDEREEDAFCRKVGHRESTDLEAAKLLLALQGDENMYAGYVLDTSLDTVAEETTPDSLAMDTSTLHLDTSTMDLDTSTMDLDTSTIDTSALDTSTLDQDTSALNKHSKSVQVNTGDIWTARFNIFDLNSEQLNSLTGIPTMDLLNRLTRIIVTDRFPTSRNLSVKEQIVMTFMRIKLNTSFRALSCFFRSSPTTCKSIFVEMLSHLAIILQVGITWPSKEEIEANLPKCFSELQQVRVVVDCTEIPVCKPQCLKCDIMLYSQYKSRHTLKYMIGISPGGVITHISLGYGGRASDKAIFEGSRLVHLLDPGRDKILVDKGFLIDDLCLPSCIEVVRPPFVHNGKLSASEAISTRSIARARVHVERMIARLKLFKLLHGEVPWELVPYFDRIMIVVAGICNLSLPILSDIRF